MSEARPSDQKNLAQFITKWGSASSTALLDPSAKIFTHPSLQGAIAYLETNGCAIAYGDPVCSEDNMPILATAFQQFIQTKKLSLVYLTASEKFMTWAIKNGSQGIFEAAEELFVDPAKVPTTGEAGRLLKKKLNHAKRAGAVIKEYKERDEKLEKEIAEVEKRWLKEKKGQQIYFSKINFFADLSGKRCFYAELNGKIVGALFLIQLNAQSGWLLYLVTITPEAPGGTSEALILTAFEELTKEGCHFFSFGVSAANKISAVAGLGRFFTWASTFIFKAVKMFFPLDSRRKFWEKFRPETKKTFIIFQKSTIGIKEIRAILKAVNLKFFV